MWIARSGATFTVTAPTQITMGQGARLDFGSWSDGGASNHVITVSQNLCDVTAASYSTSYQLSASSNPGNGSAFKFSPSSSDMFYQQGTQVTVTAVPNPGFKFGHWTGDLSGSLPSGVVTMTPPDSVVAQMTTVPYIAPAGIHERSGTDAQRRCGARIHHFDLRPKPGVGGAGWSSESIGADHRGHHGNDQQFDPSVALCFSAADQRAASFQPRGRQLHAGSSEHGTTRRFRTLTVARNAPGLFFNTIGSTSLRDGVPCRRLLWSPPTAPQRRRNHLHARHGIWTLPDAGVRWVLPAQSAARRA